MAELSKLSVWRDVLARIERDARDLHGSCHQLHAGLRPLAMTAAGIADRAARLASEMERAAAR